MSPGPTGPLGTDFEVMTSVAGRIDVLNDDVRAMLQSFIGKMSSVPPSVWGGVAAARFRDVVDRWNSESLTLHTTLGRIAETIRTNERTLRAAADTHAQRLGAVGDGI
ncbi:WXG100 family type VII secretion target [Mycolicibacterium peregrinum]|uniref:WXG100 family type VII secretion target n=1 Tax=Mycolicibacterium peregrinum TaxID=43304 RepID=A0A1X2B5D0_MYCPR|nr:WXG100 family type VII secretion target [Mycolicibacterium peregrinum]MCV7203468.1 WXG100 family type VII secretion target [Mycolicibacterium peregrinum]ORW58965.1 type VII secretion protein EsxU [Mycolicibacterium peregrinum]OWM08272.1 WXG100 family type VII secretion target [Mycolicibacterium peregrinum]TGB44443.1 WXG100 family type VII secretion target [Mycolicibacterium peregrinum]TGB47146.1 WXG100 family type VII secretion target [Mycolicibacterium peregrinum]